jgi:hypothetical protein
MGLFDRIRGKRAQELDEAEQQSLVIHMMPWNHFQGIVDLRGSMTEEEWTVEVQEGWLACLDHYGTEQATEMRTRYAEGLPSTKTELDVLTLQSRVVPPVELCPTCSDVAEEVHDDEAGFDDEIAEIEARAKELTRGY